VIRGPAHRGSISATIIGVQTIDQCQGDVVAAADKAGGVCLMTADHGNAEQMLGRLALRGP
jgi:2,3-bisphosphoglycerate-independent phosphoglycerate mutase